MPQPSGARDGSSDFAPFGPALGGGFGTYPAPGFDWSAGAAPEPGGRPTQAPSSGIPALGPMPALPSLDPHGAAPAWDAARAGGLRGEFAGGGLRALGEAAGGVPALRGDRAWRAERASEPDAAPLVGAPRGAASEVLRDLPGEGGDAEALAAASARAQAIPFDRLRDRDGHDLFRCLVPNCGKTFTFKANLKRHQMGHLGVRPFSCPECRACKPRHPDPDSSSSCARPPRGRAPRTCASSARARR